jgi:hypothetical protein
MTRTSVLFPGLAEPHRNRSAVERTIRELRAADRLEAADAGLIAAIRSTARALDQAPNPYVAATVARVHIAGLQLLAGRPRPESDELDAFIASLRPAALGDRAES